MWMYVIHQNEGFVLEPIIIGGPLLLPKNKKIIPVIFPLY